MLTRWQGSVAAAAVTLLTVTLVLLDITVAGFRRWWVERALTTDTVGGLLVLMITVLVTDQVVRFRQVKDRSRATAAQAAIVMGQAVRSVKAMTTAMAASSERDAASDEVRTYMTMLLVAAPVLIEANAPRAFLEQAQHLAAELARALGALPSTASPTSGSNAGLNEALDRLRTAATPLLQVLNLEQLIATNPVGDPAAPGPPGSP